MTKPEEIAPQVYHVGFMATNVYLVGPKESWAVVDTGLAGSDETIRDAAEQVYGPNAKPVAILLTHAHQDHCGSALALAAYWDVPIYAHRLDAPYLTGKGELPPGDPTAGGFFSFMFRFMPKKRGTDLAPYFRLLPENGEVPGLTDWRWLATPGHTPGHVSLWRESDRTLIAGDAVLTVNVDKFTHLIRNTQRVSRPPTPATYDWYAARRSVELLAKLDPATLASGHGIPMHGNDAAKGLRNLASLFRFPEHGRYVAEPAEMDENGVQYVPPPPPDPLPKMAGIALGAVLIGLGIWAVSKNRKRMG